MRFAGAPGPPSDEAAAARARVAPALLGDVALPLALYAALLIALQYPILRAAGTHVLADEGDGLQCYWNLWWVDTAVTRLGQWPWFTRHLHFPFGTTLVGHTLHPWNGLLAIVLHRVVPPWQAYNALVVQSFVLGGLVTFRLARAWGAARPGALLAGALYGFSDFHFAHAVGHLQLTSLEWLPLFLLAWTRLLRQPTVGAGAWAGVALLVVVLVDYYYAAQAVIAGAVLAAAHLAGERRRLARVVRELVRPVTAFLAVVVPTAGALVGTLLWIDRTDPLQGAHPAGDLGTDVLALILPGWNWRLAAYTEWFWRRAPNFGETTIHLSLVATALAVYASWRRRELRHHGVHAWLALYAIGVVLSIGPVVRIAGHRVPGVVAPYALLEWAVPPLRVAGVPARALLLAVLGSAMAAAFVLPLVWRARRAVVATLAAVLAVEMLPRPFIATPPIVPGWVRVLAAAPEPAALIDRVTPAPWALFLQTFHEKPMAEGYIARIPRSVGRRDRVLVHLYERGKLAALCRRFGIGYALLPATRHVDGVGVLWQDADVKLVATGPPGGCRPAPAIGR